MTGVLRIMINQMVRQVCKSNSHKFQIEELDIHSSNNTDLINFHKNNNQYSIYYFYAYKIHHYFVTVFSLSSFVVLIIQDICDILDSQPNIASKHTFTVPIFKFSFSFIIYQLIKVALTSKVTQCTKNRKIQVVQIRIMCSK